MSVLQIIAAVFAVLVAGLVALLYRTERLVRTAGLRLAAISCPRCGAVMGPDAAAAEVATREALLRKLRESAGGRMVMFRIPDWRFVCAACGAALVFDPGTSRNPLTLAEEQPHPDSSTDLHNG
jgi:predicted RNA-binding Zn-ribbon protein involved in translation (DUF1610 family)